MNEWMDGWKACAEYQSSGVLQDQVFDAGLHGDVGSDQQLQSTDCWEVLRDREKQTAVKVLKTNKENFTEKH